MNHEEVKQLLLRNAEVREAYENPPLPLQLARAVVEYRRSLGLTQTEFAELLGTSQNQMWRIESGDANLTIKTLEKLQQVLGMSFIIDMPRPPEPAVAPKAGALRG